MSKFIEQVRAQLTGRRKPTSSPLKVNLSGDNSTVEYDLLKEYSIGVTWKRKVSCEPKMVPKMLENCIRELKEAVYSDIRDRIIRLERAVYSDDREAILMETRDIIREIF